ncbi:MAG: cysteine desulfurase family protein [Candidatus Pacebacteria bacterium]|nr:cysteine desulfurase family protein [Candidatus Paceibacterota bacterium]
MKKIYLDYAATTPLDKRVLKAMTPFLTEKYGNTMSLHSFGQEAKIALEKSREAIAGLIGAKSNEIIFTGSATESNNLALKGVAFRNKDRGRNIIISSIEHPCIIEAADWLKKQGFRITKLKVDKFGLVNPSDVLKAIEKDTILVSIIHASNEIGTIEPVKEIGEICRKKGVYFHSDASQSFGKIPINVEEMKIDLLTASSHKIYGPKGAACLFVKEGVIIEPLLHGGGQETGLRSSTVNAAAVVGFAKAVELSKKDMKKEYERISRLKDKVVKEVLKIEEAHLSGHPVKRLPNITSFWFSFIEGESLVIQLDLEKIAASTGSACSSVKLEPSPVLLAIGLKPHQAHGSLRISFGRYTKDSDIDYLIKVLPEVVKKLRKISPFYYKNK